MSVLALDLGQEYPLHLVFGTGNLFWSLVLGTWYLVLGTWLVPGTLLGTWYLVRFLVVGTGNIFTGYDSW